MAKLHDTKWNKQYEKLVEFKRKNGHCVVPNKYQEDAALGNWVQQQRYLHRKNTIRLDRKGLLDDIAFVWRVRVSKVDTVAARSSSSTPDDSEASSSSVGPPNQTIEETQLDGGVQINVGLGLRDQRVCHGIGTLDAERAKRLESPDGVNKWNDKTTAVQETAEEYFDRNFDLLLVFQEREGHVRVPIQHQESTNDNLGVWLGTQQALHKHGLLELDPQKWLEAAGVTWRKVG